MGMGGRTRPRRFARCGFLALAIAGCLVNQCDAKPDCSGLQEFFEDFIRFEGDSSSCPSASDCRSSSSSSTSSSPRSLLSSGRNTVVSQHRGDAAAAAAARNTTSQHRDVALAATRCCYTGSDYIRLDGDEELTVQCDGDDIVEIEFSNAQCGCLPSDDSYYDADSIFYKLEVFIASGNSLTGELPEKLFELAYLKELDLHDNDFEGSIPSLQDTKSIRKLEYLDLSYNHFTGSVPSFDGGTCNRKLKEINLSGNELSVMPSNWETLLQCLGDLDKLYLYPNAFGCTEAYSTRFDYSGGQNFCSSCTDFANYNASCAPPTPTLPPTPTATVTPTSMPTPMPTPVATAVPTSLPTAMPTPQATMMPTLLPTASPTPVPTNESAILKECRGTFESDSMIDIEQFMAETYSTNETTFGTMLLQLGRCTFVYDPADDEQGEDERSGDGDTTEEGDADTTEEGDGDTTEEGDAGDAEEGDAEKGDTLSRRRRHFDLFQNDGDRDRGDADGGNGNGDGERKRPVVVISNLPSLGRGVLTIYDGRDTSGPVLHVLNDSNTPVEMLKVEGQRRRMTVEYEVRDEEGRTFDIHFSSLVVADVPPLPESTLSPGPSDVVVISLVGTVCTFGTILAVGVIAVKRKKHQQHIVATELAKFHSPGDIPQARKRRRKLEADDDLAEVAAATAVAVHPEHSHSSHYQRRYDDRGRRYSAEGSHHSHRSHHAYPEGAARSPPRYAKPLGDAYAHEPPHARAIVPHADFDRHSPSHSDSRSMQSHSPTPRDPYTFARGQGVMSADKDSSRLIQAQKDHSEYIDHTGRSHRPIPPPRRPPGRPDSVGGSASGIPPPRRPPRDNERSSARGAGGEKLEHGVSSERRAYPRHSDHGHPLDLPEGQVVASSHVTKNEMPAVVPSSVHAVHQHSNKRGEAPVPGGASGAVSPQVRVKTEKSDEQGEQQTLGAYKPFLALADLKYQRFIRMNDIFKMPSALHPTVKGVKTVFCSICSRGFTRKANMTAHMKSVHSGERDFACHVCGRKFARKQNLRNHVRIHFGSKPFKCTETNCSAAFANQANLIRHKKTHSGFKAFLCTICQKRFSDRSNLKRHITQVHKLQLPPNIAASFPVVPDLPGDKKQKPPKKKSSAAQKAKGGVKGKSSESNASASESSKADLDAVEAAAEAAAVAVAEAGEKAAEARAAAKAAAASPKKRAGGNAGAVRTKQVEKRREADSSQLPRSTASTSSDSKAFFYQLNNGGMFPQDTNSLVQEYLRQTRQAHVNPQHAAHRSTMQQQASQPNSAPMSQQAFHDSASMFSLTPSNFTASSPSYPPFGTSGGSAGGGVGGTDSTTLKLEQHTHSRHSSMDIIMQDPSLDSQQQQTLSLFSSDSSQLFSSDHQRPPHGSSRSSAAIIPEMDPLPDLAGIEESASAGANTATSTAAALSSHESSPMIEVIARGLQNDVDRPLESNSRRNSDSVRVGQLPSDFVDGAFGSTSPLDMSELASAATMSSMSSIEAPMSVSGAGSRPHSMHRGLHQPLSLKRDSTRSVASDLVVGARDTHVADLGSIPAIGSIQTEPSTPMAPAGGMHGGGGSHRDLLSLAGSRGGSERDLFSLATSTSSLMMGVGVTPATPTTAAPTGQQQPTPRSSMGALQKQQQPGSAMSGVVSVTSAHLEDMLVESTATDYSLKRVDTDNSMSAHVPQEGDAGDRFPQFTLGAFNTTPPTSSRGITYTSTSSTSKPQLSQVDARTLSGTQLEHVHPPPGGRSSNSTSSSDSTHTQRDASNSSEHRMPGGVPPRASGVGRRQVEVDRSQLHRPLRNGRSPRSDSGGSEHRSSHPSASRSPFTDYTTDSDLPSASRSPETEPFRGAAHGRVATFSQQLDARAGAYGQGGAMPGPGSSRASPLAHEAQLAEQQRMLLAQQRHMLLQQQQQQQQQRMMASHPAESDRAHQSTSIHRSTGSGSSEGYDQPHAASSTSRSRSTESGGYERRITPQEIEIVQSLHVQEKALYNEYLAERRRLHAHGAALLTNGGQHAAASTLPRQHADQPGMSSSVFNFGAYPRNGAMGHSQSHNDLVSQGHMTPSHLQNSRPSTMNRRQLKPASIFQQQQRYMAAGGAPAGGATPASGGHDRLSASSSSSPHGSPPRHPYGDGASPSPLSAHLLHQQQQQQQLMSHQMAGSGDLLPSQRDAMLLAAAADRQHARALAADRQQHAQHPLDMTMAYQSDEVARRMRLANRQQ